MAAKTHGAPLWTSAEAASATGGEVRASWDASGISIDSRSVKAGDLFIALSGPNHDGHQFVDAALERAAAAAMVARSASVKSADGPLLVVVDTFEGLQALARQARERSTARIVAVTGSVGKTGTKELLAAALGSDGPTLASAGNLNNHIGAPLSLARLPREAAYGVFELGMNHSGEIRPLSRLVRPHVALITRIAAVHIEMFPNLDGVADAKAEIFDGVEPGGTAVLNRDDDYFDRLANAARAVGVEHIVSFGEASEADARLVGWHPAQTGGRVVARIAGHELDYEIQLSGEQWALNSVAALAAAHAAGAPLDGAVKALGTVAPVKGRGTRHRIAVHDGFYDLIDESYNASPVAVRAAIATLAAFTPTQPEGRRIAVLGDMLELGDAAAQLHADLAADLDSAGIDIVFTAGPLMGHLHRTLDNGRRGTHAPDSAGLIEPLQMAVRPGDVVLVKGSLGSRMGRIVERLLEGETAASSIARAS